MLELESGEQVLLTDTVGFIRKLPHELIEAFRSTLEEARYADIILHVVDASNPMADVQMHVVYETLRQLEVTDKTIVTVFNKQDKAEESASMRDFKADYTIGISARTGQGLPELKALLEKILRNRKVYLEKICPYDQAGQIQLIRKYGQLLEEEYCQEGIRIRAYVPAELYGQVR